MKEFCVKMSGGENFLFSQLRNLQFIKISILILFFILPGCRLFSPSGSGTIPQVKIVEPQAGDTINTANVIIKVTVTNREGILKVRFFDNNLFLGEVQTYPYEYMWETAFVSNGKHDIRAEAVNASGNTGRSPTVSVFVTKEGMFDWNLFNSPTANNLNGLLAYDNLNIWVCGNNGTILFYDGAEWQLSYISNNDLYDLFFISPDRGWCVGETYIYKFNNNIWSLLVTLTKKRFLSIFLFDSSFGWVGDSDGEIFTFLGDSLVEYGVLDMMPITDILGFTPSDVWASCGGSLFHYDGNNWLLDTTFVGERINTLFSLDSLSIWGGGTHLFYYDGMKWEMRELPTSIGTNSEITSIYFSSPDHGVACGRNSEDGFIIMYDGIEWKEESIQKDVPLSGICKFGDGEGWAVGYDGTILHRKEDR